MSVVRALLDEREVARVSQVPPHLEKLRGKEFAEDGSDADAGEKVAAFSGARIFGGVVAVPRIVERRGHEFVESDGPVFRDARAQPGLKAA